MDKTLKQPWCPMCYNARVDSALTDDNDGHSRTIGHTSDGFTIMATAGAGRSLRIEFFHWNERRQWQDLIGIYEPNFCPNCGRRLDEYATDSCKVVKEDA